METDISWCRGFYVDTVVRNQKAIEEYIRKQEREDMIADQISFKEYNDLLRVASKIKCGC